MTAPTGGGRRASTPRPRRAMTLVELLVAITIVAILAALLLGVAATAGVTAREARTKSMISRLHTLLMDRYDLYRTRRVETLPYTDDNAYRARLAAQGGFVDVADTGKYPPGDPRVLAFTRLAALREMMKVEMPDRWSDIVGVEVPTSPQLLPTTAPLWYVSGTPVLWSTYARAYNDLIGRTNSVTNVANTREDILRNQGAECLYLVIMNATGDGETRSLFNESDVGDTDGDGALEFLDGWGRPITWLRWAPGFESDTQPSAPGLQALYADAERDTNDNGLTGREAVVNEILTDHDPYDLFRVDNPDVTGFTATNDVRTVRGWRLVPLVASAGGDGELGLFNGLTGPAATPTETFVAMADPYRDADTTESGVQRLGQLTDTESYADNIHNHNAAALSRSN